MQYQTHCMLTGSPCLDFVPDEILSIVAFYSLKEHIVVPGKMFLPSSNNTKTSNERVVGVCDWGTVPVLFR